MPHRNRDHRGPDPCRASGPGSALPGAGGLVDGNAADQAGIAPTSKEARLGRSRAGGRGL